MEHVTRTTLKIQMIKFTISDYGKEEGLTTPDLFFLRAIFQETDPAKAADQIHLRYAHGGGFHPMDGWTLHDGWEAPGGTRLTYGSGQDATHAREMARATLRDETLVLLDHAFLAIIQKDGAFKVTRVD